MKYKYVQFHSLIGKANENGNKKEIGEKSA